MLDVGCGGGLLSEPLARLGATVHGVDESESAISIANEHAQADEAIAHNVSYSTCSTAELLYRGQAASFDLAVASEVLEHVSEPHKTVDEIAQLLKPGGVAVFTTINRTALSYLLAIQAAERIARIVPRGTHSVRCCTYALPHSLHFGPAIACEEFPSNLTVSVYVCVGLCVHVIHIEQWTGFIKPWELAAACKRSSLDVRLATGMVPTIVNDWVLTSVMDVNYAMATRKHDSSNSISSFVPELPASNIDSRNSTARTNAFLNAT